MRVTAYFAILERCSRVFRASASRACVRAYTSTCVYSSGVNGTTWNSPRIWDSAQCRRTVRADPVCFLNISSIPVISLLRTPHVHHRRYTIFRTRSAASCEFVSRTASPRVNARCTYMHCIWSCEKSFYIFFTSNFITKYAVMHEIVEYCIPN